MSWGKYRTVAAVSMVAWGTAVAAQEKFELSLPLACEPHKTCFIQSYVDLDPGPGARDYACGGATYEKHNGIDFRLLSADAAKKGFAVLASADGKVKATRDGVQTDAENCVAHNGSMIPIPGRDVMVQAFYQGGITVFDWTDVKKPYEIAFFDRGAVDPDRIISAGSWSVYWYNGVIVSSEIRRGLDILELVPNPNLSQNEIDAAKTVTLEHLNPQGQPKFVWPPSFAMARAFVDQLERSRGLSTARISAVRSELGAAERASGAARRTALTTLASSLEGDASGSGDRAKVQMLVTAVRDLAR